MYANRTAKKKLYPVGTYAQIFKNVGTLKVFLPKSWIRDANFYVKLADATRVASHGVACGILFYLLQEMVLYSNEIYLDHLSCS